MVDHHTDDEITALTLAQAKAAPRYTRARATPIMTDLLDADLSTLRRLASRARSTALSMEWAGATHERAVRTASILRMLARIVPNEAVSRVKSDGAWVVTLDDSESTAVLRITTRTSDRTPRGLAQPLHVHVHRRDLVDAAILDKLEQRGMIAISMETA